MDWSYVIVGLAALIIGGGGTGFYISLRKDKRQQDVDDADLTAKVRQIAKDELDRQEARTTRLENRVDQLTKVIRELGGTIPPWPSE